MWRNGHGEYRSATVAGIVRSFFLCSQKIVIMAVTEAYARSRVKGAGECFDWECQHAAYIHHHDAEPAFVICPSCVGLPMCWDAAPALDHGENRLHL